MNVSGDYVATPMVVQASEDEVKNKNILEAQEPPAATDAARPRLNMHKVQDLALQKYMQTRLMNTPNLIKDVKVVGDPISNFQVIFDAILNESDQETFIELSARNYFGSIFRDRLYVLLSRVNLYRSVSRGAHLDLVMINIPNEERRPNGLGYWDDNFANAIESGLLKLITIELNEEEAASCRDA